MDKEEVRTYLPPSWNDNKLIQPLFAEFRKRDLNPIGWQNKMDIWVDLINLYCHNKKLAVVSSDDICIAFERNKKFPACIDEVLDYMHRQNLIKTADEFICDEKCKTWLGWSYYSFIKYPLSSAWTVLRSMLFLSPVPQKFIFLDILKGMAYMIFKRHEESKTSSNVDNIVLLKEFQKQCIDICDEENFMYAVMQLQQEGKLIVFTEPDGIQIIKFQENEESDLEFTEVDKSILRLKNAMDKNSQKITELEEQQARYIIQARQHLKERSKDKALIIMKKKKRLEIEIQKKYLVQDNLETLFNQVRNCSSEKMILDALKTSAFALKNHFSTDLTFNDVDNTMEEVREAIDDAAEIQRTLSESVDVESNDLSEFENELKDILSKESKSSKISEARAYHKRGTYGMADDLIPSFPEIPSDSIGDMSDVSSNKRSGKKLRDTEAAL